MVEWILVNGMPVSDFFVFKTLNLISLGIHVKKKKGGLLMSMKLYMAFKAV